MHNWASVFGNTAECQRRFKFTALAIYHRRRNRERFRKAGEPVYGRDQDIMEPSVLQLVQNSVPELCTFRLVDPEPQKLFAALQIDA